MGLRYGVFSPGIWCAGAMIKNVIEHMKYIIINSSMMGKDMQQASMNGCFQKKTKNCGRSWKNLTTNVLWVFPIFKGNYPKVEYSTDDII